jgi:hypothetical protein
VSISQDTWGLSPNVSAASTESTGPLTPYIANKDNKHRTVPEHNASDRILNKLDNFLRCRRCQDLVSPCSYDTISVGKKKQKFQQILRVKSVITAEKARVNTSRTPIQIALVCTVGLPCVRRYRGQMGSMRRTKIMKVMITLTALSIRVRV